MKKCILLLFSALFLVLILAPGTGAFAQDAMRVAYHIDLSNADAAEIPVVMQLEAGSQPLVLEMADSYGNGLAIDLASHITQEKAVDASGKEVPVRREGNTWYVDSAGAITFSYEVELSGYGTGTPYLDSLAQAQTPWPYWPSLDADLAYLPGYALLIYPYSADSYQPTLELDVPPGWQQALPWPDQPPDMNTLLSNPILAGNLIISEQGSLLVALPADAAAASGGALDEYGTKALILMQEAEGLLGGLNLPESQKLLLILLFRGEGDSLDFSYYPAASFSGSVAISAPVGNDPLSDITIEATARGMAGLLLARDLDVEAQALWLPQGSAWYLGDLIPYSAGLWGANLFWDLFNRHYADYGAARKRFPDSMAQCGIAAYESEDAAIILTCGGSSACAAIDSEFRSLQPQSFDLASFLRDLAGQGTAEEPLGNEDIQATLSASSGLDWSAFFRDYIQGTLAIPASSFSSLNIAGSESTLTQTETPKSNTSTSGWIMLAAAVLIVFIIPFIFEPYTMRPRKPGFLEKKLEED